MKILLKTSIFLIILICAGSSVSAQVNDFTNQPASLSRAMPGYLTINELTAGFGLGVTDVPYSKSFFGFTTIWGYQSDKNFFVGGGTGLSFYDAGLLVPLFVDVRYRFDIKQYTPYLFGDAGLLLNFSDFMDGTKMFLNPGAGVIYNFPKNLAINLGIGLLVQQGGARDTFVNIKTGVSYKF